MARGISTAPAWTLVKISFTHVYVIFTDCIFWAASELRFKFMCSLSWFQINAEGLHFSALVFIQSLSVLLYWPLPMKSLPTLLTTHLTMIWALWPLISVMMGLFWTSPYTAKTHIMLCEMHHRILVLKWQKFMSFLHEISKDARPLTCCMLL